MPPQCRICQNVSGNRVFQAREMMFGLRDAFDYFECAGCGCVQIADIPADMSRYYPANYYSFSAGKSKHGPLKRGIRRLKDSLRRRRYAHAGGRPSLLGRLLVSVQGAPRFPDWLGPAGVTADDAILDVGCGAGELLYKMRDMGFRNLNGADPFIAGEIDSGGVRIRKAFLKDLSGAYDLVMFHHSFEHVPDPEATLREAARLTKPGKRVLIRVPLAGKFAWRKYGVDWVGLDAPRHFFLHTEASLKMLADKAGLDLERIEYDSWSLQFWGSEQYRQDISLRSDRSWGTNPKQAPFTEAEVDEFKREATRLNEIGDGDQACFYLRRRS